MSEDIKNNELAPAATMQPAKMSQAEPVCEISPFSNKQSFEDAWRMATCMCRSTLFPEQYQGDDNRPNCVIAMELAHRLNISPFLVAQNMNVISKRPSWSAQYLIGAINVSGRFSSLRWKLVKTGKKESIEYREKDGWDRQNNRYKWKTGTVEVEMMTCYAYAKDLMTGEILEGPEVTMEMAVKEGWYAKDGSKWQTMPQVMLRYRAAAFFSRMYCPEVSMGLHTSDEIEDIGVDATQSNAKTRAADLTKHIMDEDENVNDTEFVALTTAQMPTEAAKEEIPAAAPQTEKKAETPKPEKQAEPERKHKESSRPAAGSTAANDGAMHEPTVETLRAKLFDKLGEVGLGYNDKEILNWVENNFGLAPDELSIDDLELAIEKADEAIKVRDGRLF